MLSREHTMKARKVVFYMNVSPLLDWSGGVLYQCCVVRIVVWCIGADVLHLCRSALDALCFCH